MLTVILQGQHDAWKATLFIGEERIAQINGGADYVRRGLLAAGVPALALVALGPVGHGSSHGSGTFVRCNPADWLPQDARDSEEDG